MKQIKQNIIKVFAFVMLLTLVFSSVARTSYSETNNIELFFGINTSTGVTPRADIEVQIWELKNKSYTTEKDWKNYLDPKSDKDLVNEFGEPKLIAKTDSNGIVYVRGMKSGFYYVREKSNNSSIKSVPTVFRLPNLSGRINIKNTTPSTPTPPDVPNQPKKGSKEFKKVDEKSFSALSGAKFKVTKKNENGEYETILDESGKQYFVESAKDGYFKVENLEYGIYYLWEVSSPSGYEKLTVPIKFKIDSQFEPIDKIVIVKNKKIPPPAIDIPKTGDLVFFILVLGGIILFAIGYRLVREKD